jgi:nucleoid-associated protein YgaU
MFVGVLALMALLFGGIRMLLQPLAGGQDYPMAIASVPAPAADRLQPAAPQALPAPERPQAPPAPAREVKFVAQAIEPSYTVADGDNLWAISQRYNTNVEALQSINNLPDRAVLRVGQRLIIP